MKTKPKMKSSNLREIDFHFSNKKTKKKKKMEVKLIESEIIEIEKGKFNSTYNLKSNQFLYILLIIFIYKKTQ